MAPAQPRARRKGLHFSVLGPVRAWRDDEALPLGSPQQRALLAALLLREGRSATVAELIDGMWGEEPPSQALAAVRTYASRLRKVLAPGVLESNSGGYALRLEPGAVDLQMVEDLAAQAEQARADGAIVQAREYLHRALALWDGAPLASVPGPYAQTQRVRLEEWRLQLLESRLGLDIETGKHAEALSELTGLTAAHPLRERPHELLMLALYRCGRQAEALAVYADTRRLLAEELGTDPRPELSALQQQILRSDTELDTALADEDPTPAVLPRPSQLPATIPDFTGRAFFVRELADQLTTGGDSLVAISALAGIGGVGKTALAVHIAHTVRQHYPDGQLYIDLQGASMRSAEPEAVLGTFLRALGATDTAIPESLNERAALYRATLEGRRVLILLDNARDAAQVRPLLPGTAGCATIVTSRARMIDLAAAERLLVDLDVMTPEEALQLFTRIVGQPRVTAEHEAALDVVAACGFLPLAIRIAASRLAAQRAWTVSTLAAELAEERHRLNNLQAGDLAVKATFDLGYDQLEPDQARAYRLLGLADSHDISLSAAAAMLALTVHDAEDLLESLVDTSLLASAAPGRYGFHDLVRLHARACAERDERLPGESAAALSRLLDFYLARTAAAYAAQHPGDRLPAHLLTKNSDRAVFTDANAALEWLFTEASALLASLRNARGSTLRRAVDILWAASALAESGAEQSQYATVAGALRDTARREGDTHAEARATLCLAQVDLSLGRFDSAEELAAAAMSLAQNSRDIPLRCWALSLRGTVAQYQGRHAEAEHHYSAALDAYRHDGNRPGEGSVLCSLSRVHLAQGRVESALSLAEQSVAVYSNSGAALRLANAKYTLGLALTQAKRHEEASGVLREAHTAFRDSHQRLWEGMTLYRLAEVDLATGQPAQAAAGAERALGVLADLGGEWQRANVLTLLGRALSALGLAERARTCWREALEILERVGAASDVTDLRSLMVDASADSSAQSA
ncbi:AfsR/SARP family transcriptional regulator [Streptomyces longwoodensis]|uniref:AfsR/SARP family transcriptional regulator n=1 Tax=Streptomyces longwoodensis TaxID=68231 RepID=UPI0034035C41